jgi:hypothetical protein
MQQFATRCIVIFADHSLYTDGPLPLRVQALDFVARQCSDRVSPNIRILVSSAYNNVVCSTADGRYGQHLDFVI